MASNDLMEEWEQFQRFEKFQQSRPQPKPEPEPVDPFKAYIQGPQGQLISDWKAFSRSYTPEQLEIHSTAPDKRFNDDPAEFYFKMCENEGRTPLPIRPDL